MGKTAVFVLACLQQIESSEKAGGYLKLLWATRIDTAMDVRIRWTTSLELPAFFSCLFHIQKTLAVADQLLTSCSAGLLRQFEPWSFATPESWHIRCSKGELNWNQ